MTMKSIRALLFAAAIIPLTLGVLLLIGVTFRLDFLDARLESLAGNLLNREVTILGPVRLSASFNPSLQLGGVTIGNPADWPDQGGHLLVVENAVAQLSLVKLIQGGLHIHNLEFEGVDLNLVTQGRPSHQFPLRN